VRFALLGGKKGTPAPTLFVFATACDDSLQNPEFNQIGHLLGKQGFLCVSLDAPCHGKDVRDKEPNGLRGWRSRLEKGDGLIPRFASDSSAVLDYLIKEGYTNPQKVAVCGTSRGGFLALHWAAAEPRVKAAVAFAPVANLLALSEFNGMEKHGETKALALDKTAEKLAGRAIWVCIGNNDQRVSTDNLIAFTRKVVAASVAQKKPALVELHVMTSEGHTIHPTAHEEAAVWVLARLHSGR
jgi:dienelactone hydrolase